MKNVNKLFVIMAIFVPLLLISINYQIIQDFYTYSVPLNSLVMPGYPDIVKNFQKMHDYKDSKCFTTPNGNLAFGSSCGRRPAGAANVPHLVCRAASRPSRLYLR